MERLLSEISKRSVIIGSGGDIAQSPLFEAFAGAVQRLSDGARAGAPDIATFRGEVARLINASDDPAVAKFGKDLLDAASAAQVMQATMDAARASAERVGDTVIITAEQIKVFKKTVEDWAKDERLISDLGSRADTASDPRQRAVNTAVGRLSESATDNQRKRAAEAAAREFDQQQAQRAQERQSREALSEARQKQNALENEAERLYRRTRSAGEAYADTIEKLNEHLAAGRIDQETYSRAVAQADEVMRQAERAVLERAIDGVSGYKRAVEDYVAAAQDMATATEDLVLNALGAGEDAFVDFVTTGKASFADLIDSMIADLARLAYRQAMASLLSSGGGDWLGSLVNGAVGALAGGFGNAGGGNVAGYMASGYTNTNSFGGPRAMGGAVQEGIDYWVGEHGPEKFRAPRDGQIIPSHALKATNAPSVTVVIHNAPAGLSAEPQVSTGADGQAQIELMFEQIEGRLADNVAKRRGPLGAAMESSYALNPMKGRGR
ncbi:phage tail tape measure C-terminal domain-containing protein [Ancylobacter dichloromethanicus]